MSDSTLDRYARRTPEPDAGEPEADDLGCFGWLRGVRERAIMLELRNRDGHVLAIGYAWIERVEYRPESGITLHLPGREVRLIGSGLNAEVRPSVRLLGGILRHRVPWIRESERTHAFEQRPGPIHVERVEW